MVVYVEYGCGFRCGASAAGNVAIPRASESAWNGEASMVGGSCLVHNSRRRIMRYGMDGISNIRESTRDRTTSCFTLEGPTAARLERFGEDDSPIGSFQSTVHSSLKIATRAVSFVPADQTMYTRATKRKITRNADTRPGKHRLKRSTQYFDPEKVS